jgi:hypothetical protein
MRTIILLALLVMLGGCYDPYAYQQPPPRYPPPQGQYQAPPQGQAEPAPDGQVVAQAPPPLQAEDIPPPPYDGAVWCEGYWSWNGASYVWVAGRYVAAQEGLYWYPGGWVARPGGYLFVAGRWAAPGWRHSYRFVYGPRAYYRAPYWRRRWR